ncbi:NAD(P)-dependent oxidoreductase [Rhodococcus sp. BGS-1C]|uniref:NAD-dependent epimerase/dehydratase family protein n=1 Tax=unclassified Rhodococcus (in: high G+C Gram-positive bacteria) TaxID=192944 RepID=UPI0019D24F01|nr:MULTISPECIES: NAD(P)-dependent oxidoreductase [unclassified Rhodococcus (in: high G+C Gram-positive bacteria)]MCC8927364.1 NAD(P)-dependent oxidoreductase [Rhodococcus sp. I2R]
MTTTYSWIVGSGGLLGSSVTRELGRRGNCVFTSSVPWADHESARNTLLQDCTAFFGLVGDGAWNIVWAAGAGVNGTSAAEFAQENALIAEVLDQVGDLHTSAGTVFLASSAGGVYAGAVGAPHHEGTRAVPLGDYGRAKLDSEKIAEAFGIRTGINVVVGRFANLYGPGQNLSKPQGLISHLCRGYLMASPVSIYVPMDTLRDYLFVSDAAEMVADALALSARNSFSPTTKIFATGQAVTIGSILGACRTVFRRRPNVVLAASPLAAFQGRDLRLRSTVWPEIDRRSHRTLPAGIASTLQATRQALGAGR